MLKQTTVCTGFGSYEKAGTVKNKSCAKLAFTESDSGCFELNQQNRRVKLPKLGWVKCGYPREILGSPNSITVKFEGGLLLPSNPWEPR